MNVESLKYFLTIAELTQHGESDRGPYLRQRFGFVFPRGTMSFFLKEPDNMSNAQFSLDAFHTIHLGLSHFSLLGN